MLLGGKQPDIKQIAIVTRNPKFSRLLATILADWKFFEVEDPAAAKVVFAEWGVKLPDLSGQVIWLTPLPLPEGSFLLSPISLTRLYHLLEVHFFPTPRRHIRVAYETKIDMKSGSAWQEGKLLSLSDRGGRVVCEHEMTRGTQIQVDMKLAGMPLQFPAEVLYCIPAGDSPGRSRPHVGLLFKPADEKHIRTIRYFIERLSVEMACAKEEISLNDPCLSWFDLPEKGIK